MKRILLLLISVFTLGFGYGQVAFNLFGGGAFPVGWNGANNVTSNAIDRTSYYLIDAGNPSDVITTTSYDLSANLTATFDVDITSFGSNAHNALKVEVSLDGGSTYTQTYFTPITTGSYTTRTISISSVSANVVLRLSTNGTSGRGIRMQDLILTGIGASSTDTELNFNSATYSQTENGTSIDLCVDITNPSATPTTADVVLTSTNTPHVTYSTTGITFPASSAAQQCVTVNIADNTICGDAADYTFELQNVSGGSSASVGTINETVLGVNDDEGTIGVFKTLSFEAGDDWGYTGTGLIENDFNKYNGTNSYEMNNNESIELDNISLTGITDVTLSVAYAATNVDGGDDLDLEISYDGGATYTDTKLIDGSSNYDLNINSTGSSARNPVQANPYIVNVPASETQIRVRFSDHNTGSSDYFYVDDIILSGTQCLIPAPEINIQGASTDIPTGNTAISATVDTDFGDVLVTGGSQVNTFTIQNTGDLVLNITSISSDLADFTIGTVPATVAATSNETFTVTFDPTTIGTKTATITIASDDADEASYTFNVQGNATDIPSIVLNSVNPAVAATVLQADASIDNTVVYAFDLSVTNFDAELTAFDFTTTGSSTNSDINNFKAYYSTDAIFTVGSDAYLDIETSSTTAGTHSFNGFSQTIAQNATGYFFITADLPCDANPLNNMTVSAITTADFTFTTGTVTGSAFASGTHTITDVAPNNVTALTTANCENSGVDLSWTAATGCKDNYIVVASLSSLVTAPTGNGSLYTADATYGSGTAYDDGFVVYKGSGTSVSISALTNGTQYFYTVFTRNGTMWSTGVEVDCTPSLIYCSGTAGPTSSADSEIEFVILNGENDNINNLTTDNCTGSSGGFVNDFTSQSADLEQGGTYSVAVEFGDCNNGSQFDGSGGVWIDWNNDGDFDDTDEDIGLVSIAMTASDINVVENFSIAVPASQAVGNYRMRIVQREGSVAASPCGTFSWGAIEDYTIEVISSCTPTHTFTAMTPTNGPIGTDVTIAGTGFTASTTASIGGVAATVTFVSATSIQVEIPSTATDNVILITEAACDVSTTSFTVTAESGTCGAASTFTNIVITEVYDASSGSLGYVEIYNGTGSTIDLSTYTLRRYGDLTTTTFTTPVYDFPSSGVGSSIASGEVLVGMTASGGSPTIYDFIFTGNGNGFNAEDRLELYNGTTFVDDFHDNNAAVGFSYLRKTTVTNANTSYDANEWTYSSSASTTDLGTFSVASASSPTLTPISDLQATTLSFSVTATEGDNSTTGDLTYKWFYTDGVSANWTEVSSSNPSGLTISGENSDNLTIAAGASQMSTISGYQFYAEVVEATTCANVSNAAMYIFPSALPVKLINFQAENQTENVIVSWATVTEINNDFFTVERSQNGADFKAIGTVAGAGNFNGKLNYELLDSKPLPGVSYYRLKQTDFDGAFEYSKIISVERNFASTLIGELYPNPVQNTLFLPFDVVATKITKIQIVDILGKIVLSQQNFKTKGNVLALDVKALNAGTYTLRIQTSAKTITQLFIKK